jgi:hypothetical protein
MTKTQSPEEVTFGDKRVEINRFDSYKGRKGVVDRIGILSTNLMRGYRYVYKNRNMFRPPTTPEILQFVKAQLGEPDQRFAMVLFHYSTDDKGELLDATKCQGKPKLWVISEARYEELGAMHRQWPILDAGYGSKQHDILVRCTEEQYQRMTFTPAADAQWKKKESWYQALKAKEASAKDKLKQKIGREMSDTEIMDLLGGSAEGARQGNTDNAGDIDLSDVLD